MSILITGGFGFIGFNVLQALLARQQASGRSARLVVLDAFTSNYDPAIKRERANQVAGHPDIIPVEGDIRDTALLETLFREHNIRRMVNCAAIPSVRGPIEMSDQYFEVNTMAVVRMYELARRYAVENFVQVSTSSVYGATTRVPFVEDDPADRPLAAYPASKRAAEMAGHFYHHLQGLNITCLRLFNVYGPNGRPDMMPIKVMRALRDDTPITVFDGGRMSRDWTYIDDIVRGIVAALDQPLGYEIINLGSGAPISLNTFIDIFESLAGKRVQRIDAPAPPNEAPITYCDNTRAGQLLGFEPMTRVEDGLRKTWDWFMSVHEPHSAGRSALNIADSPPPPA